MDLTTAILAKQRGMQAALDFEERAHPTWTSVAFQYLEAYARKHAEFISEDLTAAADEWGLQTSQPKAWGGVFQKAARAGIIVQCGAGRSKRRHASICPLWKSKIFRGDAA